MVNTNKPVTLAKEDKQLLAQLVEKELNSIWSQAEAAPGPEEVAGLAVRFQRLLSLRVTLNTPEEE